MAIWIPDELLPMLPMLGPYREHEGCAHGVHFDEDEYLTSGFLDPVLEPAEVRRRWPRLHGECPLGCGFSGIYYASYLHYLAGDW